MNYKRLDNPAADHITLLVNNQPNGKSINSIIKLLTHHVIILFTSVVGSGYGNYSSEWTICERFGVGICLTIACTILFILLVLGVIHMRAIFI